MGRVTSPTTKARAIQAASEARITLVSHHPFTNTESELQTQFLTHLSLCDVAREVRDGVRDVVVGHGEDGQLRDAALAPLYAPSTLVDGGQVGVHVTCGCTCV